MNEDAARSVLRILGIVTVLVGVILTLQASIAGMAIGEAMQSAPAGMRVQATGMLGDIGGYAIVAQTVTIVLGAVLFFASPALAKHVAE